MRVLTRLLVFFSVITIIVSSYSVAEDNEAAIQNEQIAEIEEVKEYNEKVREFNQKFPTDLPMIEKLEPPALEGLAPIDELEAIAEPKVIIRERVIRERVTKESRSSSTIRESSRESVGSNPLPLQYGDTAGVSPLTEPIQGIYNTYDSTPEPYTGIGSSLEGLTPTPKKAVEAPFNYYVERTLKNRLPPPKFIGKTPKKAVAQVTRPKMIRPTETKRFRVGPRLSSRTETEPNGKGTSARNDNLSVSSASTTYAVQELALRDPLPDYAPFKTSVVEKKSAAAKEEVLMPESLPSEVPVLPREETARIERAVFESISEPSNRITATETAKPIPYSAVFAIKESELTLESSPKVIPPTRQPASSNQRHAPADSKMFLLGLMVGFLLFLFAFRLGKAG